MKFPGTLILFAVITVSAAFLFLFISGCASTPRAPAGYTQDQFSSRLEYLRFCNHYELYTGRCLTR